MLSKEQVLELEWSLTSSHLFSECVLSSSQLFSNHLSSPQLFSIFFNSYQLLSLLLKSSLFFSALLNFCYFFSTLVNFSQFFSALLNAVQIVSTLLSSCQVLPTLVTPSEPFSRLLSSSQFFSTLLTSFSHFLTSSQLLSPLLTPSDLHKLKNGLWRHEYQLQNPISAPKRKKDDCEAPLKMILKRKLPAPKLRKIGRKSTIASLKQQAQYICRVAKHHSAPLTTTHTSHLETSVALRNDFCYFSIPGTFQLGSRLLSYFSTSGTRRLLLNDFSTSGTCQLDSLTSVSTSRQTKWA